MTPTRPSLPQHKAETVDLKGDAMREREPGPGRRAFLKGLGRLVAASGLGAVLYPLVAYFWPSKLEVMPSEAVPVGEKEALPTGASKKVRFGRDPALVINTAEKGLVAYSAVCTHYACIVDWNPASGMIECPCHAGFYDPLDGSVISGPPPAPLARLEVFKEGDTVMVRRSG